MTNGHTSMAVGERNEELEAAIRADSSDAERCIVYADWLEERGEEVLAAGYRLLGGVCDDPPTRLQLELAATVVGASTWFEACIRGAAGVDRWAEPEPDDWLEVQRAAFEERKAAAGENASPEVCAALLQQVRTSVARAPADQLMRLMRIVCRNIAKTGRTPLDADPSFADDLARSEDAGFALDLPLEGDIGSFSFEQVMVSNATVGVDGLYWRRGPGSPTPAQAFVALAASEEFLEADAYNELSPEERREWLIEDHLFGDAFDWAPMSHCAFFEWAYALLAENEGADPLVGGEQRPLLEAVERFGAFRGAATTDGSEFPFHFFVFDDAFVLSRLVY